MKRWMVGMVVAGAMACGGEGGIIFAVSGQIVETLTFYVAQREGDKFVVAALPGTGPEQRYDVRGRDLVKTPFDLWLREDPQRAADPPAEVRVLAIGSAGSRAYVGVSDPPQKFIRAELLRRSIRLGDYSGAEVGKCYRAQAGNKSIDFVSPIDRDCDGATTTDAVPDCNDNDPAIRPNAPEVCDGKDNNCDGKFAPSTQVCYAHTGLACQKGVRVCRDAQGGGVDGACTPNAGAGVEPGVFCEAYEKCKSQPDPLVCLDKIKRRTVKCTLEVGEQKTPCTTQIPLTPPTGVKVCRWRVVSSTGATVGFATATPPTLSPETTTCTPKLVVEALGADAVTLLIELSADAAAQLQLVTIELVPKPVTACTTAPLVCKEVQ